MRYCDIHDTLELYAAATGRLWVNTQCVSVRGGAYVLAKAPSARHRQGPQRLKNERTTIRARFHMEAYLTSNQFSAVNFRYTYSA